jgi:hypothetical protein
METTTQQIKEGVTALGNDMVQIILSEYSAIMLAEFMEKMVGFSETCLDIKQRTCSLVVADSLEKRFNKEHLEKCLALNSYVNESVLAITAVRDVLAEINLPLNMVTRNL